MFKRGDILIYTLILALVGTLSYEVISMPNIAGSKVEVYVNNSLKEVHNLTEEKKEVFIDTDIGGVDVVFYNKGVQVTSSNSPKKLVVKQGFIDRAGQTLIGVPDKLLIKIVGDSEDDLDFILQ